MPKKESKMKKILIDMDIGDDIDDAIALYAAMRQEFDIIGITTNEKSYRRLALSWGVTPVLCERFDSTDVLFYFAQKTAVQVMGLHRGDNVVITGGMINGTSGNTNLIKIATV